MRDGGGDLERDVQKIEDHDSTAIRFRIKETALSQNPTALSQ